MVFTVFHARPDVLGKIDKAYKNKFQNDLNMHPGGSQRSQIDAKNIEMLKKVSEDQQRETMRGHWKQKLGPGGANMALEMELTLFRICVLFPLGSI